MQGRWTHSAAWVARSVRSLGDAMAGLVEHNVMVVATVTGGHGEDETGSVKQRVRVVPTNVKVRSATCHGVGVYVLWWNGPARWHSWLGMALHSAATEEVATTEERDTVGDRNAERVREAWRLRFHERRPRVRLRGWWRSTRRGALTGGAARRRSGRLLPRQRTEQWLWLVRRNGAERWPRLGEAEGGSGCFLL
jgi:hypothetical protein